MVTKLLTDIFNAPHYVTTGERMEFQLKSKQILPEPTISIQYSPVDEHEVKNV